MYVHGNPLGLIFLNYKSHRTNSSIMSSKYKILGNMNPRLHTSHIISTGTAGIAFTSYGLTKLNRIFRFQTDRETLVLEWDSEKKSFFSDGVKCRKYWPAFFTIYFICVQDIIFCAAVIQNYSRVDPAVTVSTLFVGCWLILSVALETLMIKYFNTLIISINRFYAMTQGLRRDATSIYLRFIPPQHGLFHSSCGPSFWKNIALIVMLEQVGLACFILVLPSVAVYGTLEPFHVTLPMLFPIFSEYRNLLKFVCFLLYLIGTNEVCRLFAFYIPKIAFLTKLIYRVLMQLNQVGLSNPTKFIKWYMVFELWVKYFESYWDYLLVIWMGGGFAVIIVSNVGTLKYLGMLPLAAYLVNPFSSLSSSLITFLCLPFAVHTAELSLKIIFHRKAYFRLYMGDLVAFRRKFIEKRFSCLKSVAVCCGGFYPPKTGAEWDFFFYVLVRTADLLPTMKQLGILQ